MFMCTAKHIINYSLQCIHVNKSNCVILYSGEKQIKNKTIFYYSWSFFLINYLLINCELCMLLTLREVNRSEYQSSNNLIQKLVLYTFIAYNYNKYVRVVN